MSPFLDLPLPRFVGLKNDSEVRHSTGPDAQGVLCGTSSVSRCPADRSAIRQVEVSTKKARTPSSCSAFAGFGLMLNTEERQSLNSSALSGVRERLEDVSLNAPSTCSETTHRTRTETKYTSDKPELLLWNVVCVWEGGPDYGWFQERLYWDYYVHEGK